MPLPKPRIFILLTAALVLQWPNGRGWAETPRHPAADGLSLDLAFDYDGSRFRTGGSHAGIEVEWKGDKSWVKLDLDSYSDFKRGWRFKDNTYGGVTIGTALYKNHEERLYINANLIIEGPSQLADHGIDISPQITIANGLTKDWWIGGDLTRVFSTSRNPGNRSGYVSLTTWLMWFSRWLPNESDAFTMSAWAATNEVPGDDNALFFSLTYDFDISDNLDANVGVGTDPYTPWEHRGVYFTAGVRWRF
jgi:hypothetical protein